ncbi:MAG TPA: amino acid adenylation domain-containing protein [Kofleriaceae bacterium]|nr:amino acid adenylation domain-containing protein [Kofleriaceae bacterium]
MTLLAFLTELSQRGIQISAVDGNLDVRAPRGALTPDLRGALAERKAELLAFLQETAAPTEELPQITPDRQNLHEPFPLTDIQQAYWIGRSGVFEQGDVSVHAYLEFDGQKLDLDRLDRAWQQVVARHDMLRAILLPDGRQRILAEVPHFVIARADLRGRPQAEIDAHLAATRAELSHQVFSTEHWPLFDVRVTRLDDERTRIHFSLDLLLFDGASTMIVLDDWARCYAEPDRPLPPLELSYRDYVFADLALRDSEMYRRSFAYLTQRARELPPPPDLPLAISPSALTQTRFVRRAARLSSSEWTQVQARAAREGLSPSTILMSAFAEVLATWGRSPRFTLNVTVFNRLPFHPEIERLAGDFTSLLLLDIDCTREETFVLRGRQLQDQLLNQLEHRHVSGIQVLRALPRDQDSRRAAMPIVFTSLLGVGGRGIRPFSAGPLGTIEYFISQTPQVWIDFQVFQPEDGSLNFSWDCVDELFPAGVLDDMFAAYAGLIQALAADPEQWTRRAIRRIALPAEQKAARAAANATAVPLRDVALPALLAEQAAARPDHPAVISSARTLTYRELARRANHLGHRLAERGCQGTLVAVVMDKGWEQVVAVHGAHAAAAAYLPVDPSLPAERIRYLLAQGEVKIALTQRHLDAAIDWPAGVERLIVGELPLALDGSAPDTRAPAAAPRPDDLAYVLYTSGSTGLPKGVMIEHRSVVNRILDVNRRFEVGPADRAIALTNLHHDLSVYDLFGMVAAGGAVVIPDADLAREPRHWAELIAREGVTLWNSVPAFMEMMADALEPEAGRLAPSLRLVIHSGDWIPVTLPGRIAALCPTARVIGAGGPTETTVWDICFPIQAVDPAWRSIPYGRPMANAQYHILNEALEPCPTWVAGQMYIGGVGLARGYWRDEERTRASFITHPRTGERLYRSGDLGRYLPDGTIEFLGREDLQVKIQGHRIELGEIEATLAQHPAVQSAVALVATGAGGIRRLIAYVVPTPAASSPAASSPAAPALLDVAPGSAVVTDPLARIEFKLRRHGVRRVEPGREVFELPRPEVTQAVLDRYAARSSHRTFESRPLGRDLLARLLAELMSIDAHGLPKYRYPSGGGLYPVQVYIHVQPDRVTGLPEGLYYYQPDQHHLIRMGSADELGRHLHTPANQPVFDGAAFSLFLIGRMSAVAPLYGATAREFCLIEAGYIGQLLMTQAQPLGIGLCPIGGLTDVEPLRRLLELDPDDLLVHSMLGGPISAVAATTLVADDVGYALDEQLVRYLEAKLPGHMIPRVIVRDALPVTANGKIDRKALARLADESAAPAVFVPPSDELEATIATILAEILEVERVSTQHDFTALGANSRHVVQLTGRLRRDLAVEIRITDVYRHPTVSELAAHLREADAPGDANAGKERGKERGAARRAARAQRKP